MIKRKLEEFYTEANRNGFGGKFVTIRQLKGNLKKFFEVTDLTVDLYVRESAKLGLIQNYGMRWRIIELNGGSKSV